MSKIHQEIIKNVRAISNIIDTPIILLSLNGIEVTDLFKLHKLLRGKKFKKLGVILQTPGGDIHVAYQMIKLLRSYTREIHIIVPLYAKSAGTLICLGADKLLLSELSELGPLDTQIKEQQEGQPPTYTSALNEFKALEQVRLHTLESLDIATKLIIQRSGLKISEAVSLASQFTGRTSAKLYEQLSPTNIGKYARALEVGEQYGIRILMTLMGWSEENAKHSISTLVKSYPAHGFVIDLEELKRLGLPAEKVNPNVLELVCDLRLLLLKNRLSLTELLIPVKPRVSKKKAP